MHLPPLLHKILHPFDLKAAGKHWKVHKEAPLTSTWPFSGLEEMQWGHYSDNNRTPEQKALWGEADVLFNEEKYAEALETFLHYLRDEEGSVSWHKDETDGKLHFQIAQGSSFIEGVFDGAFIHACVPLASSPNPGTAVMRRLLELNYELRYTSVGLDEKSVFHFVFDTDAATASPHKLFEGLQELALKSDRQDDSLTTDFRDLEAVPHAPVDVMPERELAAKWKAFQRWTERALQLADTLDRDLYAEAIARIYLCAVYRLDFLLSPEGRLMLELEKISGYYRKQPDKPLIQRNQQMRTALQGLLSWSREEVTQCLHRTRSTFSVTDPPKADRMRENILSALRDAAVYEARKQPELVLQMIEFGPLYDRYLFTLPDAVSGLTLLLCAVLHPRFFTDLGLRDDFYDIGTQKLNEPLIKATVGELISSGKAVSPTLSFDLSKVDFSSRAAFGASYAAQLAVVVI